jgi:hypothetical protein
MYRNTYGSSGPHFSFASMTGYHLGIRYHRMLGRRLEVFTGMELQQSLQGLRFRYSEGASLKEQIFSGSAQTRLVLGLGYHVTPRWQVSAAPYLVYSQHNLYRSTGSYASSGGTDIISYRYRWDTNEFYNKTYAGVYLGTSVRVTGRLYAGITCAVDLKPAVPITGTVELGRASGTTDVFKGNLEPWLLYLGGGLSYRIWQGRME